VSGATQSIDGGLGVPAAQTSDAFTRYLKALGQTEWLPPFQLLQYQRRLIEQIARHARENVVFYRDRLACLFGADGSFDFSRWHDVPILERAEAVARGDEMRAPDLPENYGAIREMRTNGTTGSPLRHAANELVIMAGNAATTRMARWFSVDTARPMAKILFGESPADPDGVAYNGWSGANPETVSYALGLRTPIPKQLEWLARHRAPYLTTSPSNALALAYAATPEQARALAIEFILAIGETVSAHARETVAARLGARLAGIYSCQEVGVVATECPAAPHYHVVAENAFVEIIGEDGRAVGPGETGRVVLTGLYNYAMPFIRYAIGDVARWATAPCRCGRSLPVIAEVEGRTRSAFVFRDGSRMWPRLWDAREMRQFVPFREFQLVQLDHEHIELRYVPDGSDRAHDTAGLAAFVHARMHPSVSIDLVRLDAMPQGPSGKFEQFVSLVPVDWSPPRPESGVN
jgi:phenylacetate-CoA ligase